MAALLIFICVASALGGFITPVSEISIKRDGTRSIIVELEPFSVVQERLDLDLMGYQVSFEKVWSDSSNWYGQTVVDGLLGDAHFTYSEEVGYDGTVTAGGSIVWNIVTYDGVTSLIESDLENIDYGERDSIIGYEGDEEPEIEEFESNEKRATKYIDILAVRTNMVKNNWGTSGFQSLVTNSVNSMQASLNSAGIGGHIKFNWCAIKAWTNPKSQPGSSDSAQLGRLRSTGQNGYLKAERDNANADIVTGFVELPSGQCGLGYVNPTPNKNWMYSVVDPNCANQAGVYGMAHEMGHNMGCYHNVEDCTSADGHSNGHSSAHGWKGSYRTIMAKSGYVSKVFSNDFVSYSGQIPGNSNVADCGQQINTWANTVQNFF